MSYTSIWGDHIKDQKDCKICYAFGIMSQIEAQFYIKFYRTYFLSEQEQFDCSHGVIGCSEGRNYDKFSEFFITRNYSYLENYYPYDGIVNEDRCKIYDVDSKRYNNTMKFKLNKKQLFLPGFFYKNKVN